MIYLKPGEEQFVPSAALPVLSLVGSPEQVLARARQYRDAGANNLALQVIPGMARDLIEEFSEQVIAKL